MATQKQKRARLELKRRDELAETIQSGLRAQEQDRKQRALRAQAIRAQAKAESDRLEAILEAKKPGKATPAVLKANA